MSTRELKVTVPHEGTVAVLHVQSALKEIARQRDAWRDRAMALITRAKIIREKRYNVRSTLDLDDRMFFDAFNEFIDEMAEEL